MDLPGLEVAVPSGAGMTRPEARSDRSCGAEPYLGPNGIERVEKRVPGERRGQHQNVTSSADPSIRTARDLDPRLLYRQGNAAANHALANRPLHGREAGLASPTGESSTVVPQSKGPPRHVAPAGGESGELAGAGTRSTSRWNVSKCR